MRYGLAWTPCGRRTQPDRWAKANVRSEPVFTEVWLAAVDAHADQRRGPTLEFVRPALLNISVGGKTWTMTPTTATTTMNEGVPAGRPRAGRARSEQSGLVDDQNIHELWASGRARQSEGNVGHLCDWG